MRWRKPDEGAEVAGRIPPGGRRLRSACGFDFCLCSRFWPCTLCVGPKGKINISQWLDGISLFIFSFFFFFFWVLFRFLVCVFGRDLPAPWLLAYLSALVGSWPSVGWFSRHAGIYSGTPITNPQSLAIGPPPLQ